MNFKIGFVGAVVLGVIAVVDLVVGDGKVAGVCVGAVSAWLLKNGKDHLSNNKVKIKESDISRV